MSIVVNGQTQWAHPQIVTNGLHAVFDAANTNCYITGSSVMYNLAVTSSTAFSASFYNVAVVQGESAAGGCILLSGSAAQGTTKYTLPTSSLPSTSVNYRYTTLCWVSGSYSSNSSFTFTMGSDFGNSNYGTLTNVVGTANQIQFTCKYGNNQVLGQNGTITLNPTGWNQIGMSLSGSTLNVVYSVWVNGRVSLTGSTIVSTTSTTGQGEPKCTGNNFTFGNALYYDKALTETEVLQNYNAQKGRFGL